MLAASCHSRVWKSFSVVRRGQKELPSNQSRATAIWRLFIFVRLTPAGGRACGRCAAFPVARSWRNDDLIHILDGLGGKGAQHGSVSRADAVATGASGGVDQRSPMSAWFSSAGFMVACHWLADEC